jgi:hypothetical protein
MRVLYQWNMVYWPGRRGYLSQESRQFDDMFQRWQETGLRYVDTRIHELERLHRFHALDDRCLRFGLLKGKWIGSCHCAEQAGETPCRTDLTSVLLRHASRRLKAPIELLEYVYDGFLHRGIVWVSRCRIPCGARCRDGHPCQRKNVSGKRRCPNHGGLSTGPKKRSRSSAD